MVESLTFTIKVLWERRKAICFELLIYLSSWQGYKPIIVQKRKRMQNFLKRRKKGLSIRHWGKMKFFRDPMQNCYLTLWKQLVT